MTLHDIVVRTRGHDPETPCDLLVDGHQLLVPGGTSIHIDMNDQGATTVSLTIYAGSLRIEPADALAPTDA